MLEILEDRLWHPVHDLLEIYGLVRHRRCLHLALDLSKEYYCCVNLATSRTSQYFS
jgi:hypothetical protein